jgi:hypothetical protein
VQRYPVRATHRRNLDAQALAELAKEYFEGIEIEGDGVRMRWGAIERFEVRGDKRDLVVDLTMNPQVAEEIQRETISRYNRFLEAVTGYTAKERAKKLRKSAGEAPAGA